MTLFKVIPDNVFVVKLCNDICKELSECSEVIN